MLDVKSSTRKYVNFYFSFYVDKKTLSKSENFHIEYFSQNMANI